MLLGSTLPAAANKCDFIPALDLGSITDCFKELKSEISMLRLAIQAEQSENRAARGNICLLAMGMNTPSGNQIAEIACQEMRERADAKKKATKTRK